MLYNSNIRKERKIRMRRQILLPLLLWIIFLCTACQVTYDENQTTNTSREMHAERKIERQLKKQYDEPFEVIFITELSSGDFVGSAENKNGETLDFTYTTDKTLTTNYNSMAYQPMMEDRVLQASMGLSSFDGYQISIARPEDQTTYEDLEDYLTNGTYSVQIRLRSNTDDAQLYADLAAFEQQMKEQQIYNSITIDDTRTLDFQHEFPIEINASVIEQICTATERTE